MDASCAIERLQSVRGRAPAGLFAASGPAGEARQRPSGVDAQGPGNPLPPADWLGAVRAGQSRSGPSGAGRKGLTRVRGLRPRGAASGLAAATAPTPTPRSRTSSPPPDDISGPTKPPNLTYSADTLSGQVSVDGRLDEYADLPAITLTGSNNTATYRLGWDSGTLRPTQRLGHPDRGVESPGRPAPQQRRSPRTSLADHGSPPSNPEVAPLRRRRSPRDLPVYGQISPR